MFSYTLVTLQFGCILLIASSGRLLAQHPILLLLECGSLGLGVWAVATMKLGHFNIIPDVAANAQLIRRGPYHFVRHPMYTALLMATFALILDGFSLFRLCAWSGLLIILLVKLSYEEKLLAEKFPDYKDYVEGTKRLLPFLY